MNCCALSEQGDILICSKTETNKNPGRCRGLFCREGEQLKRFLEGLTRLELRKFRSLNFDGFAGLRIGVADNDKSAMSPRMAPTTVLLVHPNFSAVTSLTFARTENYSDN